MLTNTLPMLVNAWKMYIGIFQHAICKLMPVCPLVVAAVSPSLLVSSNSTFPRSMLLRDKPDIIGSALVSNNEMKGPRVPESMLRDSISDADSRR